MKTKAKSKAINPETIPFPVMMSDFNEDGRGVTWLLPEEGNHHYILKRLTIGRVVGGARAASRADYWLQVEVIPDNYPGLTMNVINNTEAQLADHINKTFGGWVVRRWNINGIKVKDDRVVDESWR